MPWLVRSWVQVGLKYRTRLSCLLSSDDDISLMNLAIGSLSLQLPFIHQYSFDMSYCYLVCCPAKSTDAVIPSANIVGIVDRVLAHASTVALLTHARTGGGCQPDRDDRARD